MEIGTKIQFTQDLYDSDESNLLASKGILGTIVGSYDGYPTVTADGSDVEFSVEYHEFIVSI
jgi:hypothetical protein